MTTAIISGGASGLGLACAQYLQQRHYQLYLLDIQAEAVQKAASELGARAIVADVTSANSLEQAMQDIPQLDVCINCAGIAPAKRIVGKHGPQDLSAFSRVIEINLLGTFNLMRLAAAKMQANTPDEHQQRGVIINTASIAAYDGQIGQAAYSASKGGVAAMTLPAAREFAQFGIRVMTIAPGIFATPMMAAMPDKVQDALISGIPFPKRFGQPQEFAQLVGSIIDNPMLNGEVIRLDGALRMN